MRKLLCLALIAFVPGIASAKSVQSPDDVIEGEAFLIVEGEDFLLDTNTEGGFVRASVDDPIPSFLNFSDIPGPAANVSGGATLYAGGPGGNHSDKVTYEVQFATAGTYFLYFNFSMFEREGGNPDHYLNEDSFYLPPAFDADPETDWPGSEGAASQEGYIDGCCSPGGFLFIESEGVEIDRSGPPDPDNPYFEGNYHWNNIPETGAFSGPPAAQPLMYEVAESDVGQTLEFTVSYRETGLSVDQWVFSTDPTLMDQWEDAEFDAAFKITGGGLVGDLNDDGAVDAADAGIMFGVWGTDGGDSGADLNNDGVIDAADAGALFAAWTGEAPAAAAGEATAAYNPASGLIEISANGVVNAFVESASGSLTPGNADPAPAGLLASDNASRVGLTGFGGINVTNWKSQNTPGLAADDLTLVVGPALGVPSVSYRAGSANFSIPEPATAGLLGLGLCGLLLARRR